MGVLQVGGLLHRDSKSKFSCNPCIYYMYISDCLIIALKFSALALALMWCMEQESSDSTDDMSEGGVGDKDSEMSSDFEDTLAEDMEVKDSLSGLTEALLQGVREGEK